MAHHRRNEDRIEHQRIAVINKTMKDKQDKERNKFFKKENLKTKF
jgi:hypothetical protein